MVITDNPTALMPDLLDKPCCSSASDAIGDTGSVRSANVMAAPRSTLTV